MDSTYTVTRSDSGGVSDTVTVVGFVAARNIAANLAYDDIAPGMRSATALLALGDSISRWNVGPRRTSATAAGVTIVIEAAA